MPLYRVGETWYVDIQTAEGRLRRSTGTSDKKAAQEFHDKLKERLWRREKLGEPTVTWGEAVALWLEKSTRGLPDRYRLRALDISPSTVLPLSVSLVEECLSQVTAGTFNRTLALIVAIHNTAKITPPPVERRPNPKGRTRWLTAEEWKRLQKALAVESPLLCQAAEFTLNVGLRENNVLELEWSQVDLKRRTAWIWADQVKTGHPIGVPLNDAAMALLMARRGIHKRWVFGNPDYPLYKASNRAWYAALRKAKLVGFRWHDLRHTWASWHVMSGTRIEELQQLGGWKTLQMVQRYSHLATEHLAEIASNVKPVSLRYNTPRKPKA